MSLQFELEQMENDQEFIQDDLTSLNSLLSIYTIESLPPFAQAKIHLSDKATSAENTSPRKNKMLYSSVLAKSSQNSDEKRDHFQKSLPQEK